MNSNILDVEEIDGTPVLLGGEVASYLEITWLGQLQGRIRTTEVIFLAREWAGNFLATTDLNHLARRVLAQVIAMGCRHKDGGLGGSRNQGNSAPVDAFETLCL
jgi:hypothetical protein